MKLEEIKEMLEKDLFIDKLDLGNELVNNSRIHGKWINLLADHRVEYKILFSKYESKSGDRWMYYSGRSDEVSEYVLDKMEIKRMLEFDPELAPIKSKLDLLEIKVKLLEAACSAFVNRGFNLKSAVEMRKIELGIM